MIVAITPALASFGFAQIACDAAKGLCEEWMKHYHPAKRMCYNAKIQLVRYLSVGQLHEDLKLLRKSNMIFEQSPTNSQNNHQHHSAVQFVMYLRLLITTFCVNQQNT